MPDRTTGSRHACGLAALGVALLTVAACSAGAGTTVRARRATTSAPAESPRRVDLPIPDTPRYEPIAPVLHASAPTRLSIPAIGVATPLIGLGLAADGSMEVPTDFAQAGWYTGGPRPGESGPAVVAGHVDSVNGPAVFYRLGDLRPGDTVDIQRADGSTVQFLVDRIEQFEKQAFPTATVFGPTPLAELRLVTCGGEFDRERRTYLENLVVFAHPA